MILQISAVSAGEIPKWISVQEAQDVQLAADDSVDIIPVDTDSEGQVAYITGNETDSGSLIQTFSTVTGEGVRLRSAPSTSAAILELMYSGETVTVCAMSGTWYYVQRAKTGTYGWVSGSYVKFAS